MHFQERTRGISKSFIEDGDDSQYNLTVHQPQTICILLIPDILSIRGQKHWNEKLTMVNSILQVRRFYRYIFCQKSNQTELCRAMAHTSCEYFSKSSFYVTRFFSQMITTVESVKINQYPNNTNSQNVQISALGYYCRNTSYCNGSIYS